jgi:hypothetical protein
MDEFVEGGEQLSGGEVGGGTPQGGTGVPSTPEASGGSGVPSGAEGSLTPEQLYEVKHRGKTLKVGLQELLNGYSRHAEITQRSQEFSGREKEWTSRLGQYERAIQELRGVLTDRQRLAQILQQLPAQDGSDGDEILTRAQVEAMRQKWFEDFGQQQEQKQAAAQYQAQVSNLKGQFLGELKGVYDSMAKQYPLLSKLPLFNELRLKVGTYEPQSIADAKALLANEIRELAKENGWAAGGQQSAGTVGVQGIEPPGGGGLMPPEGQKYTSLKDPGLKSSVVADIEQMMRNSLS